MQIERRDSFRVRPALSQDIAALAAIERAAASIFAQVGMAWIADGDTLEPDILADWQRQGTLWLAVDETDEPIGFLAAHELDNALFLAEVDVAPVYQGRGIGRALIRTAGEQGLELGYRTMTLTTYRDIPWNGPFYERLGFAETLPGTDFPLHGAKLKAEAEAGHDPARRCMMAMALTGA